MKDGGSHLEGKHEENGRYGAGCRDAVGGLKR
jgi:hypothetical protein